ncbi:MAG TPA: hypothetical protein VL088_14920 [Pedobacter sp.]|nr:hypothetical protein [Pedobacter sp.]
MIFDYRFEKYNNWQENNDITFRRKLENETAFDGIVKIYSLKTNSDKINKLLEKKFFGNFYHPTKSGVFLRQFEHKDSWPITNLIFIDLVKITSTNIIKTDSSWNVWTAANLEDEKYAIAISPDENIEYQAV